MCFFVIHCLFIVNKNLIKSIFKISPYLDSNTVYKLLDRASSRIVLDIVASASGLAQDFFISFPPKVKIKNSAGSVYSHLYCIYIKKQTLYFEIASSFSLLSLRSFFTGMFAVVPLQFFVVITTLRKLQLKFEDPTFDLLFYI